MVKIKGLFVAKVLEFDTKDDGVEAGFIQSILLTCNLQNQSLDQGGNIMFLSIFQ